MVLGDKSLKDMVDRVPLTIDEFLDVHGVGEAKANKYGNEFINLIRRFRGKNG